LVKLLDEAAAEIRILSAERRRLVVVEEKARAVIAWDWSDNDSDCVDDMNMLAEAVIWLDRARAILAKGAKP
jgi:hypothetical protein